jgi:hypothetical protein
MADRAHRSIGRTSMLDLPPADLLPQVRICRDEAAAWGILAVLLAITLAPTLLVAIPAMVDYPNHLARMHLIAAAGTPAASPYYQVSWGLYPNLAMDLVVPPLGRLFGVEAATRAFFLVSQILVVAGAVVLERSAKGRHQIAGFAAVLVLHGVPFALGFVNFEFGIGVALCAAACWIAGEGRSWTVRFAVHAVFVVLLFVSHFYALGIYGLTIGCYELWRIASRRPPVTKIAAQAAAMAAPVVVLIGVMALSGGTIGGSATRWEPADKVVWPLLAINGYSLPLSAASVGAVLLMLYVIHREGLLSCAPAGKWIAAGFLLVFLAMPFSLFDTAFADVRMVPAAALVVPAFITIDTQHAAAALAGRALTAVVAMVALANAGLVTRVWLEYREEYAVLKASFALMERGSRVLAGHSEDAAGAPRDFLAEYPVHHAPTLAVHHAQALVPTLFTYPGKQPVEAVPAFRHLAMTQWKPVSMLLLKRLADGHDDPTPAFVRTWHHDFDYLYLYLIGPPTANPMPEILDAIADAKHFTLYRIKRPR